MGSYDLTKAYIEAGEETLLAILGNTKWKGVLAERVPTNDYISTNALKTILMDVIHAYLLERNADSVKINNENTVDDVFSTEDGWSYDTDFECIIVPQLSVRILGILNEHKVISNELFNEIIFRGDVEIDRIRH